MQQSLAGLLVGFFLLFFIFYFFFNLIYQQHGKEELAWEATVPAAEGKGLLCNHLHQARLTGCKSTPAF